MNAQDAYGDTPLHEAIVKDCNEITNMLCSLAENVDEGISSIPNPRPEFTVKNKRGFNALHYAALKGNLAATKSILHSAASNVNDDGDSCKLIDIQKDDGYTALHLACLNGHRTVAAFLIEKDSNLEVTDNRGQTVLHSAVHQGQAAIIEMLLETNKSQVIINKEDVEGETPLHLALSREGSPPIEATLETSPVIFDYIEKAKSKNVHASMTHAVAIAAYLVAQGANPAAKNKFGNTPSDMVTDYNARTFMLGFTSTRSVDEAASSKKQYRKNTPPSISNNLASAMSDNVKTKKDTFIPKTARRDSSLISECLICSEMVIPVQFKPCGHQIVCADCGSRMKKCLKCKETIESKVTSHSAPATIASTTSQISTSAEAGGRDRELAERLQDYEDQYMCTICMERPKTIAFLCGHRTCAVCVETLRCCHMCRLPISQKINLY